MKKTLFVLLFCLSFFSFYGQEIPLDNFYVPGSSWTHWWTKAEPCLTYYCFVTTGYRYTVERDTVIAGINYHLLSLKKLGSYSDCPLLICDHDSGPDAAGTVFARIRTDSEKVYFTQDVQLSDLSQPNYISLGTEYLLYNFRLDVGSIIPADTFQYETVEVDEVDNLMLSTTATTALYYTHSLSSSYGQKLIRGIGGFEGFLPSYMDELLTGKRREDAMLEGQYSLCYSSPSYFYHFDDNGYIARDDLAANCFRIDPLTTDDVQPKREDIAIYPNPVTWGEVNFSCQHANDISSIQMADISGKLIYKVNGPFRNGVSKIPFYQKRGTYFMKITFNDATSVFRQVLVQ